jgi:hypothetical protein
MQMIDVIKRLAELDAKNPNITQECAMPPAMGQLASEDQLEMPDAISIGGLPDVASAPAGGSSGPANINISAGSGEEVSSMLATIMQLAGVKQVGADDLGMEPAGAVLTAEPSLTGSEPEADDGGDDMRSMMSAVDKMNDTDDNEQSDDDSDDEEDADESMDQLRINSNSGNSPTKQKPFRPNEFANQENQPGGGDVPKDHDSRPRDRNQPVATMERQLMREYQSFLNETN